METLYLDDYAIMALFYLICNVGWNAFFAGIATLVLALFFRRKAWFRRTIKWVWVLAGILLCTGFVFNVMWNFTVFNRLYWSYDYAGADCSPFGLGFDDCWMPPKFFHGMNRWSIRGLWLINAVLSWGSAIWLTRRVMRKKTPLIHNS